MPKLLLSDRSITTLQLLAASSVLPEELRSELADALAQSAQPAPTAATTAPAGLPAVPPAAGTNTSPVELPALSPAAKRSIEPSDLPAVPPPSPTAIHHSLLVRVVFAARTSKTSSGVEQDLTLASLVQGSQVYIAPRPQYKRPPELDALLSKIKAAQDKSNYEAMVHGHSPTSQPDWTSPHKPGTRGYVPIVPHEPTLLQDFTEQQDDKEVWRQICSGLSAIASVLLSMAGVATAVWHAGGTASVAWKTLVALFLALVVAAAEAFLYMRAFGFFHPENTKPAKRNKTPTRPLPTATVPDEETMARLRAEQDQAVAKLLVQQGQVSASAAAWTFPADPIEIGQSSATSEGRQGPRKRKGKR